MKIVICDDNEEFVHLFTLKLKLAFARKGYQVDIKGYCDPLLLIKAKERNVDIYFLDIHMPGIGGIELARLLKRQNDSEIIFVSAHDDLWRKTMKVKPIAFVRKTKLEADLPEAIDDFICEYFGKKKLLLLHYGKSSIRILAKQVLYFSSEREYVIIHFVNGEESSLRQRLDIVEAQMSSAEFLRIHNRYLVNKEKISKIYGLGSGVNKKIELKNKVVLPVSRAYNDSVKKYFEEQRFLMNEYI